MKHLFLLLIKFIPVITMAGMLVNNTLYYFEVPYISIVFDFILGNSYLGTIAIYVCSKLFNFCTWHRIIILANFINLNVAFIDSLIHIPIKDTELLSVYYIISSIAIIIAVINHIRYVKQKDKNN